MARNPLEYYHPIVPVDPERDWFLCSYPGSGRTWVRCFLGQYFNIAYDLGLSVRYKLTRLQELVPPEWYLAAVGGTSKALKPFLSLPRVRCCHKRFREDVFGGTRVIVLTRYLEDVLVSYYRHSIASKWFEGTLSEFLRVKTDELVEYHNQWVKGIGSTSEHLHLTYEGLIANPVAQFSRLLDFMRLPPRDPWVRAAVCLSSFDYMKFDDDAAQPGGPRLRGGMICGYKGVMLREDVAYVASRKKRFLQPSELTRYLLTENPLPWGDEQ